MKKLIYFIFTLALICVGNNYISAKTCTYKSVSENGASKILEFDNCPVAINNKDKELNYSKETPSYVLDNYEYILGTNFSTYKGTGDLYAARAVYVESRQEPNYIYVNLGLDFNVSIAVNREMGAGLETSYPTITKQNFFENNKLAPFSSLFYKLGNNGSSYNFSYIYNICTNVDDTVCHGGKNNEIAQYDASKSWAIYSKSTIYLDKTYYQNSGCKDLINATLDNNGNAIFTINGKTDAITGITDKKLPNEICANVPIIGEAGYDFFSVTIGKCADTSNTSLTQKFLRETCPPDSSSGIQKKQGLITGAMFKQNLCQMNTYFSAKGIKLPNFGGNHSPNINFSTLDCSIYDIKSCSTNDCKDNLEYNINNSITNSASYCQNLYSKYDLYKNFSEFPERMNECLDFNLYYQKLIEQNLIDDFSGNCPFITPDLGEKLQFVLDILKIAAPILALALSTLDFVKTIAAGDTDKESKTAFKRFGIRIGAAIMLFIIPIILAFLLDLFLENQDGYDGSNPFCDLVDLSDKN